MAYSYKRKKKNNAGKFWTSFLACLIVIILVGGIVVFLVPSLQVKIADGIVDKSEKYQNTCAELSEEKERINTISTQLSSERSEKNILQERYNAMEAEKDSLLAQVNEDYVVYFVEYNTNNQGIFRFYLKNFTATAVLISLGLLLVAVSALGLGRGYVINEYMDNMLNCAFEVAHTASAVAEEESLNSWRLGMILSSVSKAAGNHIFITDENDRVVCCCDDFPFCIHYYKVIPENLSRVSSSSDVYQGRQMLEGFFEGERLIVAVPVTSAENSSDFIGTVIVSTQPNSIFSPWKPFLLILLAIWAVVLATVLIFAFGFSKRMAKPLDEIAEASRSFARGDFSVRVQQRSDSSDEVGALIESFNKMADSLENAEKRRSEFISNVSHELRTPMTTISGFADGILDGTIPKEQEDVYLRSIRDETRRLARLVRTMLDASRTRAAAADPARRTDFDLTELIVQTLLSFESRATEKNLDVDPQLPENSVMVHADKDGITQVIYNLLDNAVKFADRGSCITLRLYKDEKKAYVAVRDIGETIPPDDLPYIFDRFHKSDRSRSLDKDGVGLGLSLVKSIINGHDEDIVVRSENGVTEFVFSLALTES